MYVDPKKYIEDSSKLTADCTYTDLCNAMGFELEGIYDGVKQIAFGKRHTERKADHRNENNGQGEEMW